MRDETARTEDPVGRTPNDDVNDFIIRRGALPAKLPKDFKVKREGAALRLIVTDQNRLIARSGTTDYVCGWADGVDTTTTAGLDAGAARCELFPSLHAPGEEDRDTTLYLEDTRYQTGVFYCFAIDRDANRTKEYLWAQPVSGQINDTTLPGEVTHPQISETSEGQGDTTLSVLSISCQAPKPLGSFGYVQPWYKNYPAVGDIKEGDAVRYLGASGGSIQFQARNALGRRKGTGTITATVGSTAIVGVGTAFTREVNNGGVLEILGTLQSIATVTDDTNIVLSANWAGKPVAGSADYYLYPLITVYLVAISKGGTHRTDTENAPSVSLLFDGNDSAPNAPTFTTTPLGSGIRLDITPVIGSRIEFYNIYRGTGSAVAFTSCDRVGTVKHDPNNVSGTIPFTDSLFTIYEKENAQVFSYYVTTVMRSTTPLESAASSRVNGTCRLNGGQDGDPTIPSRDGFKNLLFNGFIGGTGVNVGGTPNVVDDSDASQDAFNNDPAIAASTQAAIGTGASRLRAWTRWKYAQTGGATVYPTHANGNEVKMPAPGAGKDIRINLWILAWNTGTQKDKKIKLGGYYTLQVKAYVSGGTPNGTFYLGIAQYNGGASQWAPQRKRLSNDTIDETDKNPKGFAGSLLAAATATSPVLLYWTFHLDGTYTTDKIVTTLIHADSTAGDIYVKEAMLNDGYELAPYTPDMGNIDMSYPTGSNVPGESPDPDGHKGPKTV